MRAVLVGHGVLEGGHALGRGVTGLVGIHLDRHRHTMERAELFTGGTPAVCLISQGQCLFGPHLHQSIELRVDLVDPPQAALHDLATGDQPPPATA